MNPSQGGPGMLPAGGEPATLEEELERIEAAAHGDKESFEWLYRQYVRKIYGLVYRIVGSQTDADEVTQEVFCQAYRGLSRFEGRSRFYTWVFRIATNLALQHVQKMGRARDRTSLDELTDKVGPIGVSMDGNPPRVAEEREFFEKLKEAMDRLSPNHKAVLQLGPIMGHSYEEIGEILDLSPEVVKGRLHRAREKLRELMRPYR